MPGEHSPIKPIATTSSCETSTYLNELHDQVGAVSKIQLHQILMRPEIPQVKLRILKNQINNSPIIKPEESSPIKPIATTDSYETPTYLYLLNDQVGAISKENDKQERTHNKNKTLNSDEAPEDQIAKTFLASDPYIIKHKYCGGNYLIFDYINLEQDLYMTTLMLRQMMIDKESWNKIEKLLKEMNTEYTSFDKINKILHLIIKNSDQLMTSL